MLIDTHAHLNLSVFEKDADEAVKRALKAGIWIINAGSDFETSKRAVELAEKYPLGVYAAVGFHPNEYQKSFDYEAFKKIAISPKVVAIGETGLDYYRIKKDDIGEKEKQKELFKKHIELALELKKPLIIHCREAHDDLIAILNKKYPVQDTHSGVIHSFSGSAEQAEIYRGLGFKIAFNGIITFSRDYDGVISSASLEDILIETDCPYLTPVPYRGKRNEPLYVAEVAKKLAEIKGLTFEETANQTSENAKKLFELDKFV